MDCDAILAEVQANNVKVQELAGEQGLKIAQNVAAGVAGIVIPVLWFGMDWQGTAGKEVAALQSRQQYLATLAEQRCVRHHPRNRSAVGGLPRSANHNQVDLRREAARLARQKQG